MNDSVTDHKKLVQSNGVPAVRPFVHLKDAKEPPAREWLVENLIPEGAVSIWYGPGGSHKSRMAVVLAISLLTERPFLNLKTKKLQRVLMIDGELDQDECVRRALGIVRGIEATEIPAGFYYHQLKTALSRRDLKGRITELKPELIIIDSFAAAAMAKDMNKAEDVVGLIKDFQSLGARSCVVIDHTGKASDGKTPYGSIFKFNFARSLVSFGLKGTESDSQSLRLTHVKSNFGRLLGQLEVRVVFDDIRVGIEPDGKWQSGQKSGNGTHKATALSTILSKLQAEPQGVMVTDLMALVGVEKHTIQKCISTLRKDGHQINCAKERYSYVPDLN